MLLSAFSPPTRLAVDRVQVYWIDEQGRLMALPRAGAGLAPRALATGQRDLHDLALDPDHVYWLTFDGARRVAKAGGPVEDLTPAAQAAAGSYLEDIVAVGRTVFWTAPVVGSVMMRDPERGIVQTAASITAPRPEHLAADEAGLYVWSGASVVRIDRVSGAVRPLFTAARPVGELRVAGRELYWSERPVGRLWTASVDGAAPRVLVSGKRRITGLATDGARVYWIDHDRGEVLQTRRADGATSVLAAGLHGAAELAVEGRQVFFGARIRGARRGRDGVLLRADVRP